MNSVKSDLQKEAKTRNDAIEQLHTFLNNDIPKLQEEIQTEVT